jgi:hypothetical protein
MQSRNFQETALVQSESTLFINNKYKADLNAPLNQGMSKSSSSAVPGPTNPTALENCNPAGGWMKQVSSFVSQYSTDLSGYGGSAGYGGTVEPTPVLRHFNQGIGNGAEGGDPGKSSPHGGSNDEFGRQPGDRFIPLK